MKGMRHVALFSALLTFCLLYHPTWQNEDVSREKTKRVTAGFAIGGGGEGSRMDFPFYAPRRPNFVPTYTKTIDKLALTAAPGKNCYKASSSVSAEEPNKYSTTDEESSTGTTRTTHAEKANFAGTGGKMNSADAAVIESSSVYGRSNTAVVPEVPANFGGEGGSQSAGSEDPPPNLARARGNNAFTDETDANQEQDRKDDMRNFKGEGGKSPETKCRHKFKTKRKPKPKPKPKPKTKPIPRPKPKPRPKSKFKSNSKHKHKPVIDAPRRDEYNEYDDETGETVTPTPGASIYEEMSEELAGENRRTLASEDDGDRVRLPTKPPRKRPKWRKIGSGHGSSKQMRQQVTGKEQQQNSPQEDEKPGETLSSATSTSPTSTRSPILEHLTSTGPTTKRPGQKKAPTSTRAKGGVTKAKSKNTSKQAWPDISLDHTVPLTFDVWWT